MKILEILISILNGCMSSTKKFVNFDVLLEGFWSLFLIAISILISFPFIFNPFFDDPKVNLLISSIPIIFLILIILLSRKYIQCSIKILDYYIHRKKTFKNGHVETGNIIKINTLGINENDTAYYLTVDLNGKQILSTFFLDNIYSVGESIDVIIYKNHRFVILKN